MAVQVHDTRQGYGWVAITLHWLTAVLVIALWLLGERMGFQPTRELEHAAQALHVSYAVFAWPFLVAFVIWRLTHKSPALTGHWALTLLARIVQGLLLLAIAIQVISGPLAAWSMRQPISAFGLFEIPPPITFTHDQHELLEAIHGTTANVILVLFVIHVLGALKHLFIDKDGVFERMMGINKGAASE
ncbi:MAG: cytochrome b [Alphaproteobacteria bacterium]